MKALSAIFLIALAFAVVSCKKGANYPIVGKWQQVKLRTYNQSYSGVISNDTTYLQASFDTSNYAQFNNDGTCIIGLFYPRGLYLTKSIALVATQKYNYKAAGTKYVLTTPTTLVINPGGFGQTDTASLNSGTVLIHQVFDGHAFYTISDAYYSK